MPYAKGLKIISPNETLAKFIEFIKSEVANGSIVPIESAKESDLGWISYKCHKLYLDNSRIKDFYGKFKDFMAKRGVATRLSKPSFQYFLYEKGLIHRYITNHGRWYFERKIIEGHAKFRVMIFDLSDFRIES